MIIQETNSSEAVLHVLYAAEVTNYDINNIFTHFIRRGLLFKEMKKNFLRQILRLEKTIVETHLVNPIIKR